MFSTAVSSGSLTDQMPTFSSSMLKLTWPPKSMASLHSLWKRSTPGTVYSSIFQYSLVLYTPVHSQYTSSIPPVYSSKLQYTPVYPSTLQYTPVYSSILPVYPSILQYTPVYPSTLLQKSTHSSIPHVHYCSLFKSAFVISKTHISGQKPRGRQINTKVCVSKSAIFVYFCSNNDISVDMLYCLVIGHAWVNHSVVAVRCLLAHEVPGHYAHWSGNDTSVQAKLTARGWHGLFRSSGKVYDIGKALHSAANL